MMKHASAVPTSAFLTRYGARARFKPGDITCTSEVGQHSKTGAREEVCSRGGIVCGGVRRVQSALHYSEPCDGCLHLVLGGTIAQPLVGPHTWGG